MSYSNKHSSVRIRACRRRTRQAGKGMISRGCFRTNRWKKGWKAWKKWKHYWRLLFRYPLLEKRVGKQIHVWVLASAAIVTLNFSVWEAAIVVAANNVSSSLCCSLAGCARRARRRVSSRHDAPRFARGWPLVALSRSPWALNSAVSFASPSSCSSLSSDGSQRILDEFFDESDVSFK